MVINEVGLSGVIEFLKFFACVFVAPVLFFGVLPILLEKEKPRKSKKGRRMVDDDRFSVEEVLEIGRRFQQEDRWHGAHYDTAKLLCDTIEKLYAEVKKCHKALGKQQLQVDQSQPMC
jgi:hypothetical protein